MVLRLWHFPKPLKHATIITIPKPGKDQRFQQNYRPIGLLNTVNKITEMALIHILTRVALSSKILPNEQFCFRTGHSTTDQLLRVVEFISGEFNMIKSASMVVIDVSKTFDKVWHKGLFYKLFQKEYPP